MSVIVDEKINIMDDTWDPRTSIDRRKDKLLSLRYNLFGGRRGTIRRLSDTINSPVIDKYDKKILIKKSLQPCYPLKCFVVQYLITLFDPE